MATIRNIETGREVRLWGRSLVGRSPSADLRLTGKGASNEHATILWDGAHWVVRDLTSRNGTHVNRMLLVSQSCPLNEGDEIVFGDPTERWSWLDSSAPRASAQRADGVLLEARDALLLLPDEDAPRASVSQRDGHWEAEVDGVTRTVTDGESLTVGSQTYRLSLPSPDPQAEQTRTVQREERAPQPRLRFVVSSDEEHVQVLVEVGAQRGRFPERAFNYVLLVLARVRDADQKSGIAEGDAGWIYSQELARMLNTSVETLNVDVHRARRAASQLGLLDEPTSIVERRRSTGQIRLGIRDVAF